MKLFSYAFVYAFFVFVLYCLIRFLRFVFVRIKSYLRSRKVSKSDVDVTEKKDD